MKTNAESQKAKRARYAAAGRCTMCGHKVSSERLRKGRKTCGSCIQKAEKRKQGYIAEGKCGQCLKPRGETGTTLMCRVCQSRLNKRTSLHSSQEYRRRRAAGWCGYGGCKRRSKMSYCRPHLDYFNRKNKKSQRKIRG